jgi:hypothetical protein
MITIIFDLVCFIFIRHQFDSNVNIPIALPYLGIIIQMMIFVIDIKLLRKVYFNISKYYLTLYGSILSLVNGSLFTYVLVHSETGKFGFTEIISGSIMFIVLGIVLTKLVEGIFPSQLRKPLDKRPATGKDRGQPLT